MGRSKRVFGWTYEELSELTMLEPDAIKKRVNRGLNLDNLEVLAAFVEENKRREDEKPI